jgi:hypothetical protein
MFHPFTKNEDRLAIKMTEVKINLVRIFLGIGEKAGKFIVLKYIITTEYEVSLLPVIQRRYILF